MIPTAPAPAHGHTLAARLLIRGCNKVALATRMADGGHVYVSLAAVATDSDGCPLLLLSQLSDHTRNLLADAQAALLFDGTAAFANPQEGPRATLMGRIAKVPAADLERVRRRYLASHPGAALYAGFADFAFFRATSERIHWIGGFGKAAWVGRPMTVEPAVALRFIAAEPELLARLAPLADRVAKTRLKRKGSGWSFGAIDPDGCVLVKGKRALRLAFAAPLEDPAEVEAALEEAPTLSLPTKGEGTS